MVRQFYVNTVEDSLSQAEWFKLKLIGFSFSWKNRTLNQFKILSPVELQSFNSLNFL